MKEQLKDLLARFRGLAIPLLIGFFLIIYAGLGIVYLQQHREQNSLNAQIADLENTVSQKVQISEELQAQYNEAKQSIPAELKEEDVILAVLRIAEARGFDVSIESSDISITSALVRTEKAGQSNYQVLPFHIAIEGDYDKVMDFISDMDSALTLKTLVVEKLSVTKDECGAIASLEFGVYTMGK